MSVPVFFPIVTIDLGEGGRIGVCPLPGGDGDLSGDMETVCAWNPAIVLSMTEQKEMDACGSGKLGEELNRFEIDWVHFPVPDFGGPAEKESCFWPELAQRLHRILDRGDAVLLHCRGGRGRSGMIALRLMIERGEDPDKALSRLREKRPGAVETDEQRQWAFELL